ncbi:hypothetical protein F4808DRAFT_418994 [Astrocystis sublimbata]|nr:hypothetical protein F4808DRAFT_418994 [Astrocystis sublimbata]
MGYSTDFDNLVEGRWYKRWGVKFQWTSQHIPQQQLLSLIHVYDKVAADAVDRLSEIGSPPIAEPPHEADEKKPYRGMYELLQEHASRDEKIGKLWSDINTVPEWVDWEQLERGQKVFFRYGGPAITTLTFFSLLGGMGSARTVETLDRTGGFDVKVVRRRLLETMQHILAVHKDLKSIQPGGEGFIDSIRVRLLHASVRRRIMQMASQRPEYYDLAKLGVPINELDSLGTISAFSTAVMWIGLPRQGIYMRKQEEADYLALWRYVAYIMGAPHDWMATPESARGMMESLLVSEICPSAASANLANNIITGLQDHAPTFSSRQFMCAQTHWLSGRDLAEKLEIDRPSIYYSSLMLGQCLLFMAVCYINRSFAWLDDHNIDLSRRIFNNLIIKNKSKGGLGYKSRFLFKFVPQFDRISTERGAIVTGSGVFRPGIERTALISLISFSTIAATGFWYGRKFLAWALG